MITGSHPIWTPNLCVEFRPLAKVQVPTTGTGALGKAAEEKPSSWTPKLPASKGNIPRVP